MLTLNQSASNQSSGAEFLRLRVAVRVANRISNTLYETGVLDEDQTQQFLDKFTDVLMEDEEFLLSLIAGGMNASNPIR